MALEFQVLGEVEVLHGGKAVDLGHARQRCVLAVLLVEAARVVPADVLLDRVWAARQPRRARNALSSYVSRLRRVLAVDAGTRIDQVSGGYRLMVDPLTVDVHRFRRLVAEARAADDVVAVDLFERALGLWQGPMFATLDTPWLCDMRAVLESERFAATLDRNDVALRLGRHNDLLSEVSRLADAHPLDERIAGQFMQALYGSGRQADALRHFDMIRVTLADELGADPSQPLREIHVRMLNADPSLVPDSPGTAHGPVESSRPVPMQLPAPPRFFTGRDRELAQLDTTLTMEHGSVTAISGTAGVGKTALALHWMARVTDRFPDGQLYVNLRGFGPIGSALSTDEALRGLLDALGVPADRTPSEPDARVALYRSLLAARRMLILLDNARDADHVRNLIPGTSANVVVVTSRDGLTGLVINDGACPIALHVMTEPEAYALLTRRIGMTRVAAEPEAVTDLIVRCAGLPLALAIVAGRAAVRTQHSLQVLADELRERQGLEALSGPDPVTDPGTVFSWSYQALTPPAARLFRMVGTHIHPEFTLTAAASLAGASISEVRSWLAELTDANLLAERAPCRFTVHDLLYAYAIDLSQQQDDTAEQHVVTLRMLDHYLHTAHLANQHVRARHYRHTVSSPQAGVTVEPINDHLTAMRWLTTEQPALLAALRRAVKARLHTHTWELACALFLFLSRRGRWRELVAVQQAGIDAAHQLDDKAAQSRSHHSLACAYTELGRYDQAHTHFDLAIDSYRRLSDPLKRAKILLDQSFLYSRQHCPTEALNLGRSALDLCLKFGDEVDQAFALNCLAAIHVEIRVDLHQAIEYGRKAVTLAQQANDPHGEAATWDTLGSAHHHLGEYEQALRCYQRSLDIHTVIGERYDETIILTHIGDTHHAAGNPAAARTAREQALTILIELDHPDADRIRLML